MIACQNSELTDIDHFVVDNKMVEIGSGAKREQKDYRLTRYACYLIARNANPRLKIVALVQTYFAVQIRRQKLTEKNIVVLRKMKRDLTRKGNYSLNQTAKNAGVKNFDKFHNVGYKGLYNGKTADDTIRNWLHNRSTLDFLTVWELLYNPNFKVFEFEHFRK